MVSIDLDGLKRLNDTEGHAQGDALICRASEALRGILREQDFAARLGGDEFGVVGVECDRAGARSLLGRIQNALAAAGVEASLGLACRDPRRNFSSALEEADQAMYASKRARRAGRMD